MDMVVVVDMTQLHLVLVRKEMMHLLDLVVEVHGDLVDNLHHQVDHKEIMVEMAFQPTQATMLLEAVVVLVVLVVVEQTQVLVDMVVLVYKCQQHSMIRHQE